MNYDLDIPLEAARFGVSESLPYADWLAHVADRGWDKQEAFSAYRRARYEEYGPSSWADRMKGVKGRGRSYESVPDCGGQG